jgi:tRNA threonylcarbamoyladenosine biosynthesis protein TsaE
MPDYTWRSASPEDTRRIAGELAALIPPGATVQLTGNLGAGKTTLTQSLAAAWGVAQPEEVSSPTFTLIHEFGEPVALYHIDLYRLDTPAEYYSLGLEDLYDSGARVLIEWGEKFAAMLPENRIVVTITHSGGDTREISATGELLSTRTSP